MWNLHSGVCGICTLEFVNLGLQELLNLNYSVAWICRSFVNLTEPSLEFVDPKLWSLWIPSSGVCGSRALEFVDPQLWSLWIPSSGVCGSQALEFVDPELWSLWIPSFGVW